MLDFHVVRCPACAERGERPVVMEIATGLARGKCPACKRRVWAHCDGREVRVGMVDVPLPRLAPA
ncbi:MAG: hypothetical protein AB7I38_10960 [Dehalococcoidia bacterium]